MKPTLNVKISSTVPTSNAVWLFRDDILAILACLRPNLKVNAHNNTIPENISEKEKPKTKKKKTQTREELYWMFFLHITNCMARWVVGSMVVFFLRANIVHFLLLRRWCARSNWYRTAFLLVRSLVRSSSSSSSSPSHLCYLYIKTGLNGSIWGYMRRGLVYKL